MNIKQIEKRLTDAGIEQNEAKIEAKMLVRHFLGLSDVDLIIKDEFEITDDLEQAITLRAQKRIPIQHIIGTAYFMGENFIVNENVLIPRDETEILVRKAVEIVDAKFKKATENNLSAIRPFDPSTIKVLDIGTGSGCIACMIAKLSGAQVLGVDISVEALKIALENASKLELFNKAIFRKSDIFSKVVKDGPFKERFDLIVSNPPYIPIQEKESIQIEVGFEPDSALFAKDFCGIEFYEKITNEAPDYLNDDGYLLFELGIGQSDWVEDLMQKRGFKNIEIEKDLAYIDRVIIGKWEKGQSD